MAEETVSGKRSRIAENTVALVVAGVLQTVFTLLQLGILSRFLGGERFGLYVALRGFALLLSTVILAGFPQVLVRYLPSFQGRGRRGSAVGWFFFFSSVAAALGIAVLSTSGRWAGLMPGNLLASHLSGDIVRWMVFSSIALALKLILYGGLSGLREMRVQMMFELSYLVVFTAVLFLRRDSLDVTFLFQALTYLNAAVWAAGVPVYLYLVSRSFSGEERAPVEGVVLPSPAGYWGSALALSYAALAFTDVDRFVMSTLLPVAAISIYHVAARITLLMRRFLGFPVVALQPELTRVYEEGRWDELSGRIGLFTKASVMTALAIAAFGAATGGVIISLVSGREYSGAYRLLLILLPTVPAAAFIAPLTAAMRGLHYMKWAVVCDLAWMSVYFAGLFVLVPRIGLTGTVVAQLIASSAQAAAAVSLSRREGFYAGAGGKALLRALAGCCLAGCAGALACMSWGLPAAAACIVLAPILLRYSVRWLRLFAPEESASLVDMLKGRPGSGIVRWALSMDR